MLVPLRPGVVSNTDGQSSISSPDGQSVEVSQLVSDWDTDQVGQSNKRFCLPSTPLSCQHQFSLTVNNTQSTEKGDRIVKMVIKWEILLIFHQIFST